jgi:hypothetical protein
VANLGARRLPVLSAGQGADTRHRSAIYAWVADRFCRGQGRPAALSAVPQQIRLPRAPLDSPGSGVRAGICVRVLKFWIHPAFPVLFRGTHHGPHLGELSGVRRVRLAATLIVGVFRHRAAVTQGQILLQKLDSMPSTVPGGQEQPFGRPAEPLVNQLFQPVQNLTCSVLGRRKTIANVAYSRHTCTAVGTSGDLMS